MTTESGLFSLFPASCFDFCYAVITAKALQNADIEVCIMLATARRDARQAGTSHVQLSKVFIVCRNGFQSTHRFSPLQSANNVAEESLRIFLREGWQVVALSVQDRLEKTVENGWAGFAELVTRLGTNQRQDWGDSVSQTKFERRSNGRVRFQPGAYATRNTDAG